MCSNDGTNRKLVTIAKMNIEIKGGIMRYFGGFSLTGWIQQEDLIYLSIDGSCCAWVAHGGVNPRKFLVTACNRSKRAPRKQGMADRKLEQESNSTTEK